MPRVYRWLCLLALPALLTACDRTAEIEARLAEVEAENVRLQMLSAQLQAATTNPYANAGAPPAAGSEFGDTRSLPGAGPPDPQNLRQDIVEQVLVVPNTNLTRPSGDRYQRLVRPDQAAGVYRLMEHVGNLPRTNAYPLRNTNWAFGFDDEEGGDWASFLFGDNLVISNSSELDRANVAIADYGGSNVGCVGPNCVVLVSVDGSLSVEHFHIADEGQKLWNVVCVDWRAVGEPGAEQPTDEDLLVNSNQIVTWRSDDAWCMRHEDAAWFDRITRDGIDPDK